MPRDLTTKEMVIDWLAPLVGGTTTERLLDLLEASEEEDPDGEWIASIILACRAMAAVARDGEAHAKDIWYKAYIGSVDDKTTEYLGTKLVIRNPTEPKKRRTEAKYVPNLDAMMEACPPHEFPELWTLIPAEDGWTKGSTGSVAVTLPKKAL